MLLLLVVTSSDVVATNKKISWQTYIMVTNVLPAQSAATSMQWCGPRTPLGWVKMAVDLSKGPSYSKHSHHTNHFFAMLPPEQLQKSITQPL